MKRFHLSFAIVTIYLFTGSSLFAQYSTSVSISTLTPATSSVCDGSYPISATVVNDDAVNPTNGVVQVQYWLDGVLVSTTPTSGPLAGSASEVVSLGTFGNKPGKHRITATVVYAGNTSSNTTITNTLTVQFSGTYTIGSNPTDNFATLKQSVDTINTYGLCGATTVNCIAGHTEINSEIILNTLTTSVTRTLNFNGNASVITAGTGTSLTTDGIIKIAGTNYVTFDGFVLQENPANTTPTTRMEWGFALCKRNGASPLKGAQHDIIRNCNISLNKTNNNSVGIYMGNHLATSTSQLLPLIAADLNSYNKFYNNNISNVYTGISLNGYADVAPYSLLDKYNEVGVDGRNTVTNFGVGTSPTTTAYGIYANYQDYLKIANDSINGGTGHLYTLSGIKYEGRAHYVDVYNNILILVGSSSSYSLYGIYDNCKSTGIGKTSIKNNIIKNCKNTSSSILAFHAIYCNAQGVYFYKDTLEITNNIIKNNRISTGSGEFYAINYSGYSTANRLNSILVHDNVINDNRDLGLNAHFYALRIDCDSVMNTMDIYNNTIYNDTANGDTYCINCRVNFSNGTTNCHNNEIYNLQINANVLYAITFGGNNSYVYDNIVHDITNQTGKVYTFFGSGFVQCSGNVIYSINSSQYYGLFLQFNNINGRVYKNKIYNLSANSTSAVNYGIYITTSSTSNNIYVYNNTISDLKAPVLSSTTPGIQGISIFAMYTCNIFLFYNTIYMNASSSGTNFGTSGIYLNSMFTSINPVVLIKNNLIENNSIANGSGKISALGLNLLSMSRYSTSSDYNCFSAGNPGPNNVLMYNYQTGTGYPTLAGFKAFVAPREQNSINENPPFVNIVTPPFNLHLQSTAPTLCESGGVRITIPISITDDYDGNIRWGEIGYSGAGTAPDLGAYEGNFVKPITVNLGNDTTICDGNSLTINAGNPGATYQWSTGETTQTINVTTPDTYMVTVTNDPYQMGYGSINVSFIPSVAVSVTITESADSVCLGTNVTYTATPVNGGTSPFYQWKVNGNNMGANSNTFIYAPSNNDNITCVVTSNLLSCTSNNPATSNTLNMFVYSLQPVSVSISANQNPVCSGTNVIFTAIPANGGTAPTYQWYLSGSPTGTNSPTFNWTPANGNQIYCTMSSNLSCISGNPATSNTITMTVGPAVDPIVFLGNDTILCTGWTLTLNAGNAGATYLWSTGASTQTINVNTANTYSVTVTNCPTHVASDAIIVTISPCTGIEDNTNPANISIYPNPANDHIIIENSTLSNDVVISIFTIQGFLLFEQNFLNTKTEIDIKSFAKGIYFVKIGNADKFVVKKFVKE